MGPGRLACCAFALIGVALGPALGAGETAGPAPDRRYQLSAADGIPGAVFASLTPDRPGVWRASATFTGRSLAGLWFEDASGRTIRRMVGPSPLTVEINVDGRTVRPGDKLRVRFAPTTAHGRLVGELVLLPPASTVPAPVAPPLPQRLVGPGAVLAPGFGDDAAGRALRNLAESLENAKPPAVAWGRRWAGQVAQAAGQQKEGEDSRRALDQAWTGIAADPAPDQKVGAGMREVLAGVEDLARRQSRLKNPDRVAALRARRATIVEALERLAAPQR